jgi:hypothetical protein
MLLDGSKKPAIKGASRWGRVPGSVASFQLRGFPLCSFVKDRWRKGGMINFKGHDKSYPSMVYSTHA